MIGFYNYSVIVTYISLASTILGMTCCLNGQEKYALILLAFSGFCDMWDGKIARRFKRTEDEMKFGIQIDSLCDVVCFGAFPAIFAYEYGMKDWYGILILIFYATAAVIRLGFFNVMEEKRQSETDDLRTFYQGLPVTSISVILPLFFLLFKIKELSAFFLPVLHIVMLATGILFIINFKFKKPSNKVLAVLVLIVSLALLNIFVFRIGI